MGKQIIVYHGMDKEDFKTKEVIHKDTIEVEAEEETEVVEDLEVEDFLGTQEENETKESVSGETKEIMKVPHQKGNKAIQKTLVKDATPAQRTDKIAMISQNKTILVGVDLYKDTLYKKRIPVC